MPAPNAGGLYKCNCRGEFVEASPSRVLRDGEGSFLRAKEHYANAETELTP
jgi:hypothetical protein